MNISTMKRIFFLLLALTVLASCAKESLGTSKADEEKKPEEEKISSNVPGVALVQFSDEMIAKIEDDLNAGKLATRSMELNQAMDELGITSMKRLFPYAGEYEPRTRAEGLHRCYMIKYSKNMSSTRAEAQFDAIPGVEHVEGMPQIELQGTFNDPYFPQQWGLSNSSHPAYDVNVEPVWKYFTTGSPQVVVSVVDGGIDLNHADLKENLYDKHYDAIKDTMANSEIIVSNHATHVAGIISAVNNNGTGICGIAGGDFQHGQGGVRLMSCQIFKGGLNGSSAAAIKWGADHGAVISQNSWQYTYDADKDGKLSESERQNALKGKINFFDKLAVDYFIKYAGCDNLGEQLADSPMKGGVVIFAAGNDGLENGAPANYDKVIAVGAITSDGSRASYSNYGDFVDLCAPGSVIYSSIGGSRYSNMNGTSMACPHVSGVAALLVSHFGGQGFTAGMLKEKLLQGADYEAVAGKQIGSLVDAYGAFMYGSTAVPSAVTDPKASVKANESTLSWTATADTTGAPAYGYLIIYGTDSVSVKKATHDSPVDTRSRIIETMPDVGATVSTTFTELEFSTKYFYKVIAYSVNKHYADPSPVVSVRTPDNHAPEITTNYSGTTSIRQNETIRVPLTIKDPDGHAMTISYKKGSSADSFNANTIIVAGSDAGPGTYTAIVKATDQYGASTEFKFTYVILENQPPVITCLYTGSTTLKHYESISVPFSVSDPEDDAVSVSLSDASQAESLAGLTREGFSLEINALKCEPGTYEATIVATDRLGASSTCKFDYTVLSNTPPSKVKDAQDLFYSSIGEHFSLNLDECFDDPDGETLVYSLASDASSVVGASINGNMLTGAVNAFGATTVSVTASDSRGATAVLSFMVIARSEPYLAYPNPVTTNMFISTGATPEHVSIKMYSQTGAEVTNTSVQASTFSPAKIDLSGVAPGKYRLEISFSSHSYTQTIVKR